VKISSTSAFIVAGNCPWDKSCFDRHLKALPGVWLFAQTQEELAVFLEEHLEPRYIFFIHWSQRIPDHWLQRYECVCFHMTDVPFGRGGSPLQNLIERGHRETQLSALRMTGELDAGPVYQKQRLSLEGNAEEIYIRAGRLSAAMIAEIAREKSEPVPQNGEVVVFKRRTPAQSVIPDGLPGLDGLHDFIRMLDAEGYPKAFFEYGGFRFEFSRAALYDQRVVADVRITSAHQKQYGQNQ
jgi:methionyl-tRNA formyltransferase